jgi:hypothetical protein
MTIKPTDEQVAIIDAFIGNSSLAIEAGAGTGKSATLRMMAAAQPYRRGVYIVYNKAAAVEAQRLFPQQTACSTIHSLAFRSKGYDFQHRLGGGRETARQTAEALGMTKWIRVEKVTLSPAKLARIALDTVTNYCNSADETLGARHVPIPKGAEDSSDELDEYIVPFAREIWADFCDPNGHRAYSHDAYLKNFQLSHPVIQCDYIMLDECFPAGTMVDTDRGRVPIEQIVGSDEGWRVLASVDGGKTLEWADVTTAYRTPRLGPLVRIEHEHGEDLVCTTNHPLYVEGRGWVEAGMVRRGDALRCVRQADRSTSSLLFDQLCEDDRCSGEISGGRSGTTSEDISAHESRTYRDPEPDGGSGGQESCVGNVAPQRASSTGSGRKRSRGYGDGGSSVQGALFAVSDLLLGDRVCRVEWTRKSRSRLADSLQDRYCISNLSDSYRGRRKISQIFSKAGSGCQEGLGAVGSRVDSVEVLEPGGDGRFAVCGGFCSEVFTLSTTSGSYFAGGVLVKNCQDSNPVAAHIFDVQTHAQRVAVGDSQQALYTWRGAVDFLSRVRADKRMTLSQSFRFGQAVADEANTWLEQLDADLRLVGSDWIDSKVEHLDKPRAILCRTNATVVAQAMAMQAKGRQPAIASRSEEIKNFAEAAISLKAGKGTGHRDLFCFKDWGQLKSYVESDKGGHDLRTFVKLIDDYGAQTVINVIQNCLPENVAEVVISTAHASKGREWDSVLVADDFQVAQPEDKDADPNAAELRLAYVAVTRAKLVLDCSSLHPVSLGRPDRLASHVKGKATAEAAEGSAAGGRG